MRSKFEDYNFTHYEEVTAEEGLIKCYNGSYKCVSQTEALDDWLGPWISFLWFLFLCISAFSIRMIYKTFIKFRDTLTYRDSDDEYQFKEDCIYEHETALGCWKLEGKTTIKKTKIIYFVYTIPLLIAWSDLFLDIGYISSFTFNETRMISPFIEVRPGIFILMGMFDILGTFRIFLCAAMLWKFSEKLYTQDDKMLAQLEVHMEIVVVAFAFILEDFAELFVEYFCVEKYITGYDYEKETAQSFTAAVSSITLNLIALLCFVAFVMNFRKQQQAQSLGMNILSCTIPVFELTLSSLRTYRFLFQAFFWTKFRPGCVILASNSVDEVTGEPLFKAYQDTFSKECFRPLDWIMIVLMCIYIIVLIVFVVVYVTRIRPQYNLEMKNIVPDDIIGDPKKLPTEMTKLIPKPIVKTTEKAVDGTKRVVSKVIPGSKSADQTEKSGDSSPSSSASKKASKKNAKSNEIKLDYDPKDSIKRNENDQLLEK